MKAHPVVVADVVVADLAEVPRDDVLARAETTDESVSSSSSSAQSVPGENPLFGRRQAAVEGGRRERNLREAEVIIRR